MVGWPAGLGRRVRARRTAGAHHRQGGARGLAPLRSELDRWVLVWTEGFGAATIIVSFASRIEGPWSEPMEVYRPPEGDRPGNLIYAGKAHPELDGADLPVTYVASEDYHPRFVKLTFLSS